MKIAPLIAALLLALLPGCFLARDTLNDPLPPGRLAALEPGVTTAEQAAQVLGAPADVVQLGHRSAWRYEYAVEKRAGLFLVVVGLFNSDTRSDRVWLFFDEAGVLSHVASTLSAEGTDFAMPWVERD